MFETASPDHWLRLANEALQREDYARAADAFNRYLAQAPHDTATHYTLAMVYIKSGRPDYAVQLLDGLVRQQPQNADAAFYRGAMLAAAGRSSEAVVDYQRALQLNPLHPGALQALQGLGMAAAAPYGAPIPTTSWVPPRSELMTTTDTDSQDLMSLLSWGGVVVLGIAAFIGVIAGLGMVTGRGPAAGWLILGVGVVAALGDFALIVWLLRREIDNP